MVDRRTEILDAALSVLAADGMRGLTHRAVDAAAGIAPGSTSYYFRTRAALVAGCVDRLVQVDRELAGPQVVAGDLTGFLDLLVAVGEVMASRERMRTLARYELSVAAMHDDGLRALLGEGSTAVARLAASVLAELGATDAERSARDVLAAFDGVLFSSMVRGEARVGAQLRAVVGPVLAAQPGLGG
ncbi:TetR/AcrR family transcriptional regulator [Pseudonocardia sp. CA-107938]|uniref:TetR/AcrR family transcriptional regulator n=1 Tax=Pseudonocardia sp. CA-107938 TaxID=3240021 RepID=UPI003D89F949